MNTTITIKQDDLTAIVKQRDDAIYALRLLLQEVETDIQALACVDLRIINMAKSAIANPHRVAL